MYDKTKFVLRKVILDTVKTFYRAKLSTFTVNFDCEEYNRLVTVSFKRKAKHEVKVEISISNGIKVSRDYFLSDIEVKGLNSFIEDFKKEVEDGNKGNKGVSRHGQDL